VRIVQRVGVLTGEDVRDVACGGGSAAIRAAQSGARVVGLDLTPPLFDARRREAAQARTDVRWGGFHGSSHRSTQGSCDGSAEAKVRSGWSCGDAVAGASDGGVSGASSAVLGCDRSWGVERGRRGGGGVSVAVGVRWFREGGGMSSVAQLPLSGRYLSFAEREEIALLRALGVGCGRSRVGLVARPRRSRESFVVMPRLVAVGLSLGRARRSGMPIAEGSARSQPSLLLRASCDAMCRIVWLAWCRALTGVLRRARMSGGSAGVTAVVRIAGGRSHGARSRSLTACAWTSPMMSRCRSRMRRSISRWSVSRTETTASNEEDLEAWALEQRSAAASSQI